MSDQVLPLKNKLIKPKVRGWRAVLTHHAFRRVTQMGFAGFILFLVIQHVIVGESSSTVVPSAEAFCPFGGFETLYMFISSGGKYISHTHLSNLVVLAAVLVTALLLRSAFCGWICPLGFLQEMVMSFSRVIQKRFKSVRKVINRIKSKGAGLAFLDRYLRLVKYLVLAWTVGGAAYFGVMIFRDYDPWSTLLNLAEFSFTPGAVVLATTLLASFFVERPWCRYACPLGAASGLLAKFSPVYLQRQDNACKLCQVCTKACPMGLPVHSANQIRSADCIGCLECVEACPRNGALELKLDLPILNKSN